jgi:hypothetical protein
MTGEELNRLWADPPGLRGQLTGVQNDKIGTRLLLTGFFFLLLGGSFDSFVMRMQLAVPENSLVSPQLYNELFTNHGTVVMFLVILPIFEGFAILLLPLLLGTREMPFPRLGAFSYYTFLLGGLLYYSSTLFKAVPDAGWFAYTPLSGLEFSPDLALDFWVLGLGVAEVAAIAAGIEIIIGVLKMRAPGMTLSRIPLFAWAVLVMAFMILFAFTTLIIASLLLELDRGFGTQFFNPQRGGSSLLWQHLFWIFGHPEVYIQFVPATGVVSMIVATFARHRIVGYTWQVGALVAIGFLSFSLWAHHMFAVGLPTLVLSFFAAASMVIALPAGVQFVSWLATIWSGRPVWRTPFLFVVGFLVTFVIGGITGVMVAAPPFDLQSHDSTTCSSAGSRSRSSPASTTGSRSSPAGCWTSAWAGGTSGCCSSASTWPSSRCTSSGCWGCRGGSTPTRPAWAGSPTTCSPASGCSSSSWASPCSSGTWPAATGGATRRATTPGAPPPWSGRCRHRRPSTAGRCYRSCAAATPCGTRTTSTGARSAWSGSSTGCRGGRCAGGPR